MGLLGQDPRAWMQASDADRQAVQDRIEARTRARIERRYGDADRIRDELADEGVILEDRPDGTTDWRKA